MNHELKRPIDYKQLCDWAFYWYYVVKDLSPELDESGIAKHILKMEYNKENINPEIREIALKNMDSIESIPDLILAILNMEAQDGRTPRLYWLFVLAMIYSIKAHLPSIKEDSQLKEIGITLYLIQREIKNRNLLEEKSDEEFQTISELLIGHEMYKGYPSVKEKYEAINKLLDTF